MLQGALYEVVELKENSSQSFDIVIKVLSDHDIFHGHFPGNPILPGACQVEIVKEILQDILKQKVSLSSSSNMKFLAVINPVKNPIIHLNIELNANDGQIQVRSNASFPDGTINFKFKGTFVQL